MSRERPPVAVCLNFAPEKCCQQCSIIAGVDLLVLTIMNYLSQYKMVVQAFVSSRLDYCNSLLCGIAGNLLQKLQSVQNTAARLITRTGRREHITPVLRELHGLPVRQALHCLLPQYLAEDCQLLTDIGRRSL